MADEPWDMRHSMTWDNPETFLYIKETKKTIATSKLSDRLAARPYQRCGSISKIHHTPTLAHTSILPLWELYNKTARETVGGWQQTVEELPSKVLKSAIAQKSAMQFSRGRMLCVCVVCEARLPHISLWPKTKHATPGKLHGGFLCYGGFKHFTGYPKRTMFSNTQRTYNLDISSVLYCTALLNRWTSRVLTMATNLYYGTLLSVLVFTSARWYLRSWLSCDAGRKFCGFLR